MQIKEVINLGVYSSIDVYPAYFDEIIECDDSEHCPFAGCNCIGVCECLMKNKSEE